MKGLIVGLVLSVVVMGGYAWGDATTKDAGADTTAVVNVGYKLSDNPLVGGTFVDLDANLFPGQVRQLLIDFLAPAAQEILKVQPDAVEQYLKISPYLELGNNVEGLTISVTLDGHARPAATAFAQKAVDLLPTILNMMEQNAIGSVQAEIHRELDPITDNLGRLQREESDYATGASQSGLTDTNPEDVQDLASKLDEEKQQATIDRAARQAKAKELGQAIAQLTQDSDQKSLNDPIAHELETIVKLKEDRVKLLKQQTATGLVTPYDMDDAESQAAEAHVQLLERREAVAKAAGSGDLLADLQRQLIDLQVEGAEGDARLDAMKGLSKSLQDVEQYVNKIQSCKAAEADCQARSKPLEEQLNKLQAWLGSRQPPTVTVHNDGPDDSPFTSPVTK